MSFVILILIFLMLYVCLKKYSSIFSVALVLAVFFGTTTAFLFYGMYMFSSSETFLVVNTEINSWGFYHVCIAWYIADMFCAYRAIKQYTAYVRINSN